MMARIATDRQVSASLTITCKSIYMNASAFKFRMSASSIRKGRLIMSVLRLVSHKLCPYVQRAVISLLEKGAPFERIDVDLSNKPAWFTEISPLGKTPVLLVGEQPIFESAVILEYLEETHPPRLHPGEALRRAEHRAWIEFASSVLNDIWALYSAHDLAQFEAKRLSLTAKFARLEARLMAQPWFDGGEFSLVDAVFGPVFRYFDVFDLIGDFGVLANRPKLLAWRAALASRPSVKAAASPEYPSLLWRFLRQRQSHMSTLMALESLPMETRLVA
jgi:glutathione S-transferase